MSLCKICRQKLQTIMPFGKMPISNRFVSDLSATEFFYELSVGFCPDCYMVQLEHCVEPELMFNEDYAFQSSTSQVMSNHFKKMAEEIIATTQAKPSPFVVELGCNDGIMLQHIHHRGIAHLGVEPSTNVAAMARKKGIHVIEKFFNTDSATEIVQKHGLADIICGANVMCHIERINSVFEGINMLLQPEGVFLFEDPYLYDIILNNTFDQIYDEHVYYFCGLSVSNLAQRHNLQLVDMKPQSVHGGSMRYYIKKGKNNPVAFSVDQYLDKEKRLNLDTISGYLPFEDKVKKICSDLSATIRKIKSQGHRIAAYGATSKSATLLMYSQVGKDLIDYVSDTTPTKIGKYTPGTHIPVMSHEHFLSDSPPYTVLLAWNHKREIFEKEKKYRQKGGKFITFFPEVAIE
jgi:methylation protein EvaC